MMSGSISPSATVHSIDVERLRASLRVVLASVQADRATERIVSAPDQIVALRDLGDELTRRRYLARLHRRFATSRLPESISPRGSIALLAHVALDVDGERLEDGFGLDGVELGQELLDARAHHGPVAATPCREMAWLIGRYLDVSLSASDRVRLVSHLQGCDSCRLALEAARQSDSFLLAAVDREMGALPPRNPTAGDPSRLERLGPIVFAGGALALLVVALAIGSFVSGLVRSEAAPVPLFTSEPRAVEPLDGWLLQVSPVGFLEAVDLSTGYKRGLDSGDSSGGFSPLYRVSRTHIASWRPSDGQRDDALTIGRIGEQFSYRLTWNRQFVYWYPSGWLDDDTLLIVKSPDHIPGETERDYIERLTRESRLVAFDADSGEERVLLTGNVSAAFPSPDGTMLAIYQPLDRRWPGASIELRQFDGQSVGEPIVRIEHRVVGDGVWLADSSAYVAAVVADVTVDRDESRQARTLVDHGVQRVALERIDRNGARTPLTTANAPESVVPLASAPDGQSVVFQIRADPSARSLVPDFSWHCYRIDATGGEPVLLTSGTAPERIFRPTWSPDGDTMIVPVARAFPLAVDDRLEQPVNPNATTLLIFGPEWTAGDSPAARYSSGRDLYGWLPPDALNIRTGAQEEGSRSLAAVPREPEHLDRLLIDGAASDEQGTYLLVVDEQSREPLAWSATAQQPRRLVDGATDRSWFNQGTATIAVVSSQDGEPGSRIVLNAADITRSVAYLDYRFFDPAGIGSSSGRSYAQPLVSPTGFDMSFFVIDTGRGQISLWIDDEKRRAAVVGTWSFPADGAIVPRLVAGWVAPDTLLVAIPADWQDGLPTASLLARVVIGHDGVHQLDELTRVEAPGSSSGVELVEFALSPDGSQLAYRLRQIDTSGSTEDTVHVAATDDLSRAIEIERGGRGEGLLWTADGQHVIAGVRGRVASYAADGRSREYLSPRGVAVSDPVRIGNELWFNGVDGSGSRIWMVALE